MHIIKHFSVYTFLDPHGTNLTQLICTSMGYLKHTSTLSRQVHKSHVYIEMPRLYPFKAMYIQTRVWFTLSSTWSKGSTCLPVCCFRGGAKGEEYCQPPVWKNPPFTVERGPFRGFVDINLVYMCAILAVNKPYALFVI